MIAVFCLVMVGEGIGTVNLPEMVTPTTLPTGIQPSQPQQQLLQQTYQKGELVPILRGPFVCRFVVFETNSSHNSPELIRATVIVNIEETPGIFVYAESDFFTAGTPIPDAGIKINGNNADYLAWKDPIMEFVGSDIMETNEYGQVYCYADTGSTVTISKAGFLPYSFTLPELSPTTWADLPYFANAFQVWLKKPTLPSPITIPIKKQIHKFF